MATFKEWLEQAMFDRGGLDYRYSDLARDLGVSQNTASTWRNGGKISHDNIHKLAVHFATTSRAIYALLDTPAPDSLNDDEEIMFGLIKRLERDGHADNFIRVLLEKAAKGELSDATKAKIMAALEADAQSGLHANSGEPVAAPKRKKA